MIPASIKPPLPRPGALAAVISPSWGGPSAFPNVFEAGLKVLKESFGFRIKEYPTTRESAAYLDGHPEARARDFNAAFADREVGLVVSSIGGSDAIRLLPYLDLKVILENPKPVLGYSDATAYLAWLNLNGLVTYYANGVMSGFAQLDSFPEAVSWHSSLFEGQTPELEPFPLWTHGYRDWATHASQTKEQLPNPGFTWVQGGTPTRGRLWGGCCEVLEMLKGTRYWPGEDFWTNRVLFLETSEEKPSPRQVMYWLRNYGAQGVFSHASALWIGRAKDYTAADNAELRRVVSGVVAEEWGGTLPVVMDLDFGHTDPRWALPLGVDVLTDPLSRRLAFLESPFS